MRLVLAGGTGQLGLLLARNAQARGDDVVIVGRAAASPGSWTENIDGADVVVNLAGRNINCRYTPVNKREIMESRIESTRVIGEAIAAATRPPRVWLQMSTATIYAHTYGTANDEVTGTIGGNEPDAPPNWKFSIDVARAWETTCLEAATPQTRKVLLRTAVVVSPDRGGAFDLLLRIVRLGLGGAAGNGRQYVSWITGRDFVRAVDWLIEHDRIGGVVNLAAPNPVPYAEFMADLRRAAGVPIGLPATKWMIELGTRVMGTESELVLKSRRVVPRRLLDSGFSFLDPEWNDAARELVRAMKA